MTIDERTLRRHLNQVIRLEFQSAARVQALMAEVRNDLRTRFPQLSGFQANMLIQMDREMEVIQRTLEQEFNVRANYAQPLYEGHLEGLELVLEDAGVPPSSLIAEFQPLIDIQALADAQTSTLERVRDIGQQLQKDARAAIVNGVALGEGTSQIKDRILGTGISGLNGRDGIFRPATWRAEAIARTTANEVLNAGKLSTFGQMNQEFPELEVKKRFDNIGDRRTSKRCSSLIGQVRELDQEFQAPDGWTGQAPPTHPFCRSTITPLTVDYEPSMEPELPRLLPSLEQLEAEATSVTEVTGETENFEDLDREELDATINRLQRIIDRNNALASAEVDSLENIFSRTNSPLLETFAPEIHGNIVEVTDSLGPKLPKLPKGTRIFENGLDDRSYVFEVGKDRVEFRNKGGTIDFTVNRSFLDMSDEGKNPNGTKIGLSVARVMNAELSTLPDGTILDTVAARGDGKGDKRQSIYQRVGFYDPGIGQLEGQVYTDAKGRKKLRKPDYDFEDIVDGRDDSELEDIFSNPELNF